VRAETERESTGLQRWAAISEWPLMLLAVAFLVAYAWPILDTELPASVVLTCTVVTWLAWAAFAVDYAVRVALAAPDRRRYVLRHLHDLAVILLPLLRPLRLLRLVTVLGMLHRRAGSSLRGRVAVYAVSATTLLTFVGALAMLDVERHAPDANITTFGDAVWWSAATITTVGYGDRFPTTGAGRVVALGLMLAGIALLGLVTATLASWIIEQVAEENATERAATAAQVDALMAEVRVLRAEQSRGRTPVGDHAPG
jgi:voltage-gated potassium channel